VGYYMAGGYYQAGGGFFKRLGKLAAKVAPAISLINPALGSALNIGAKLAHAGTAPAPPPAPSFPGMGYGQRARRVTRRRRRRSY
jgi:hypothetical protein